MDKQDFCLCFLSCRSCASMLRKVFEVLCASASLRQKWVGFFRVVRVFRGHLVLFGCGSAASGSSVANFVFFTNARKEFP